MIRNFEQIDLHMHTTVSDGTDTPEEILRRVAEAGIPLFSVTDHDAVKGCKQIQSIRAEGDPAFVTGIEFSCKDAEGKYHILGYGFDPDAKPVRKVVATGHGYRMQKVFERLDFLERQFGITFPEEDRMRLLAMDNPGKPHLANLMVQYGYARTKEQAMSDYIDRLRFPNEYVRPEEAIEGILAGGGIPVLAHPSYGSGDQLILGEEMDARLKRLMGYGLQGIEAFYSGFTERLQSELLSLAEKYGLYVTAGSDYHGMNKLVSLGDTNLNTVAECPEGLRKFFAALGYGD